MFSLRRDTVIEPGEWRGPRYCRTSRIGGRAADFQRRPRAPDPPIRHTVGDFLWELVAGRKEPHETPAIAARRELLRNRIHGAASPQVAPHHPHARFCQSVAVDLRGTWTCRGRRAPGRGREDHSTSIHVETSRRHDPERAVARRKIHRRPALLHAIRQAVSLTPPPHPVIVRSCYDANNGLIFSFWASTNISPGCSRLPS